MLKNTGKYAELYVAVCVLLCRPVDEERLKLMEEQRATIAPCDNVGEIVSPVVITIAIGFESLFDSLLPIGRAPYFANNGAMGGWRNERFRGEAPLMLTIIFSIRIMFCWIEMKVRARQRGNETDASAMTDSDLRLSSSSGEAVDSHSELPSSADEGAVVTIELSSVPHCTTSESADGASAMVALGHHHPESPSNDGNDDITMQTPRTDTGGAAARSKTRRSSMAVLYTRTVGSDESPVHMQYLAGALFALQPPLFVAFAARFGREL